MTRLHTPSHASRRANMVAEAVIWTLILLAALVLAAAMGWV